MCRHNGVFFLRILRVYAEMTKITGPYSWSVASAAEMAFSDSKLWPLGNPFSLFSSLVEWEIILMSFILDVSRQLMILLHWFVKGWTNLMMKSLLKSRTVTYLSQVHI